MTAGEARTAMNNLWVIQYWSRRTKSELSSDWNTKGFGEDEWHRGIRQPKERRTVGCRVDKSAAGGDLKTSGKKVTLKGQVKPFASTFFNIERNFWWGQSSELRWTNAEGKRHVVHLCDVTRLGWWLLTFAFNTGELQHTETILCILTHKIVERLNIITRPPYTLRCLSRSGPTMHLLPSARPNLEG